MQASRSVAAGVVLGALSLLAQAQDQRRTESIRMDQPVASLDVMRGVIMQLGQSNNGWGMCIPDGASLATVRPAVEEELQRRGVQGLPTPLQVNDALTTRYPCPFSPQRAGLRAAAAADVEGAWVTREASLKLRYPPRSPAWQNERPVPLKCEGVGFFADGEARTVELRGNGVTCPEREHDFSVSRSLPRVAAWSVAEPGRVVITRSDVPDFRQEWESYLVETGFRFAGVEFAAGDLVQYLRVSPGVARSYAMQFRHLRKLP